MGLFSQKKVWHSYLKRASPVVLRWKGAPVLSKYDEGDQYLAYFEVQGDPTDGYYYYIESEDVLNQLRNAPYKQWVRVTATGDNADTHVLDMVPYDGATPESQTGLSVTPRSTGGAQKPDFSTGFIADDYAKCLLAASNLAAMGPLDTDDPTVIQAVAATLYISWSRTGFTVPLASDGDVDEYINDLAPDYEVSVLEELDKLVKRSGKSHDNRNLKSTIAKIETEAAALNEESYESVMKWIRAEVDYQLTEAEEEEIEDDLPF